MKKLMMAVAGLVMAGAAVASTATTFAYQGVLRNEFGKAISANTATIEFRLYEGADADTAVWGRKMALAIDTNGLFNAELSDNGGTAISGISETLEAGVASTLENVIAHAERNGKSVYVGLTVQNSSGEIRPRQKLLPVPMAGYAQNVAEAKGDFTVGGDLQVSGAIGIQNGTLTAGDIEARGATFNGVVQMENGATIGGSGSSATNLTVNGATVVKGSLAATGDIATGGNINLATGGNVNLASGSKILMNGKYEMTMPIGSVIIWSGSPNGSALPKGWVLCAPASDGSTLYYTNPQDGKDYPVPDLRGRFVLGMNADVTDAEGGSIKRNAALTERTTGATGGVETVTLTLDQMPRHTHGLGRETELSSSGNGTKIWARDGSSAKTGETGGGQAHENMPPFYALCYIIFVGDNLK